MNKKLALAVAFAAFLPMLMAPSGGFPSRPVFQSVGINHAPRAGVGNIDAQASGAGGFSQFQSRGTAGTNTIGWCQSDTAAVCSTSAAAGDGTLFSSNVLRFVTASGADLATLNGTGVKDITPSGGTFSGNYTNACTTTPSGSFAYDKIGNTVTLRQTTLFSCTSDSTAFILDAASLPAAIRPATDRCAGIVVASDNSVGSGGAAVLVQANGGLNFAKLSTATDCTGNNWTAANIKGLASWTITYTVD